MTIRNPLAWLALLAGLLTFTGWPAAADAVEFIGPTNYAVPNTSDSHALQDIAVGDFGDDGDADLATVHEDDDKVSILLGNGNGTFTGPTHYPLYSHANPLSIA